MTKQGHPSESVFQDPDRLLNENQAREFLGGFSTSSMRNLRRAGTLRFVKLNGRTVRYRLGDLIEDIGKLRVENKPAA